MKSLRKTTLWFGSIAIVFAIIACNASPSGTQSLVPTDTGLPAVEQSTTPVPSDTPLPSATVNSAVTITVLHDSMSIRRGPSVYYDVLAYFVAGETATASARNSDGSWVYIGFPANPSSHGWVSAVTNYSSTQGDINSLPIMNADPPVAAYIRNCTFHPMKITPGNLILQNQLDMTNRISHFAPGTYSAWDQSETGPNPVFTVTLTEGDSVDINVDGFGNMYYCP